MSVLDWLNPIGKALDIADKAVVDKDKKIELKSELNKLRENVYLAELKTQTVPWVDALHKMGRQMLSYASLGAGVFILYQRPEVDPFAVLAIVAPGGVYNYAKGRGK